MLDAKDVHGGFQRRALKTGVVIVLLMFFDTAPADSMTTILHAGELLTVPGEAPLSEQTVVVNGGLITRVEGGYLSADELGMDRETTVVDLKSRFVLPGFIDLHVHLNDDRPEAEDYGNWALRVAYMTDALLALRAQRSAWDTLQTGFTTIRDGGSHGTPIRDLRDAIRRGYVDGPRIVVAMSFIEIPGGIDDISHGMREEIVPVRTSSGQCSGVDDCRTAVRRQAQRGADYIKVDNQSLSGRPRNGIPNFTDEEMAAIVDAARRLGLRVSVHAIGGTIRQALDAGVDSIEHAWLLQPEDYRAFRSSGAYLVATMMSAAGEYIEARNNRADYTDSEFAALETRWHQIRDSHAAAFAAGIPFAFGTDTWALGHGTNNQEFLFLDEIGMSPMQAIEAATVNAADVLGMQDEIGTIETGKSADIIAVAENPLEDMSKLLDVRFVMAQGSIAKHD